MEMEKERTCATLLLIAVIGRNHGQIQLFLSSKYPLIICLNPTIRLGLITFWLLGGCNPCLSVLSAWSLISPFPSSLCSHFQTHVALFLSQVAILTISLPSPEALFSFFWHQNGLCNAFSISLPSPPFWIFCQQASSPAPLLTQYLSLKLTMISFLLFCLISIPLSSLKISWYSLDPCLL